MCSAMFNILLKSGQSLKRNRLVMSTILALAGQSVVLYLIVSNSGVSWAKHIPKDEDDQISSQTTFQAACDPAIDSNQRQYIIGYGSLMQEASKHLTDLKAGPSFPVTVKGYSRAWNCKGIRTSETLSTTFLGIREDPQGSFVAVSYEVFSDGGMKAYDIREEHYCRREVKTENVKNLEGSELGKGQHWIYVTKPEFSFPPSEDYPIVQSYVDTFLSGCLELEDKFGNHSGMSGFAEKCVRSTQGWDSPWVNDRIYPRRPTIFQPKAFVIDKLLANLVPNAYKRIRIE